MGTSPKTLTSIGYKYDFCHIFYKKEVIYLKEYILKWLGKKQNNALKTNPKTFSNRIKYGFYLIVSSTEQQNSLRVLVFLFF